jgi:hypothetical protein
MIYIDVVNVFNGYKTCYYQTFVCGKPSPKQLDVHKQCREWLWAAIDRIQPGVTTAEIASLWPSAKELDYADEARLQYAIYTEALAKINGEPVDQFIARSTAGPGAGGSGAVFFEMGSHRVKLALDPLSPTEIMYRGGGIADLYFEGSMIPGRLAEPGFHCPDQRS